MNTPVSLPLLVAASLIAPAAFAAGDSAGLPLAEAVFSEVVNDVQVVPPGAARGDPAKVQALFKSPDLVKTGRKSRAQLTAADGTIARVGSNAVFSFAKDSRTVNLERGSILFHSPTGKGGGAIVTNAATAAVVGTTIIVTATSDGGFKMFVLEGVAKVKFPDGRITSLNPGQMTFVLPAGSGESKGAAPGPVLDFDLGALTAEAGLLVGFGEKLPSADLIGRQVDAQNKLIAQGELLRTGLFILGADSRDEFYLVTQDAVRQAVDAQPVSNPRLDAALAASYAYTGGSLPSEYIFTDPVYVPNIGEATGFIVGHLEIGASMFDLSALDGLAQAEVIGASSGSVLINGSTYFEGLYTTTRLRVGGSSLSIAPGSTISVYLGGGQIAAYAVAPAVTMNPAYAEFFSKSFLSLTSVQFSASGVQLVLRAPEMLLTDSTAFAGAAVELYSTVGKLEVSRTGVAEVPDLSADRLYLRSATDMTLSGIYGVSYADRIALSGGGFLTLTNGSMSAGNGFDVNMAGGVEIATTSVWTTAGDVTVVAPSVGLVSSSFTAGETAPGAVTFRATGGDLTISGDEVNGASSVSASQGQILLESIAGKVLLSETNVEGVDNQETGNFGPVVVRGATLVSLTNGSLRGLWVDVGSAALPQLDVTGTVMSATDSAAGIRMEAKTVNLSNVTLPNNCSVRLLSKDGVLNVGSSLFGAVNFVSNVSVGDGVTTPVSLMDASGINANVWVQGGTILYQGAPPAVGTPMDGATGTASASAAGIHVQASGAAPQDTKFSAPK